MRTFLLILLLTVAAIISSFCQVQEFFVQPSQTDSNYAPQDSHFIAYNTINSLNKLLLFIGGTFSSPKQYDYFCKHAAGLGFDVISLRYPNSVLTTLLAGSSDSLSFNHFRQEICFGTQVSSAVNVDSFNSIYTRTEKLLKYLSHFSPERWSQYLNSSETPEWSKIVVSGHSQGAGHACYLAKMFPVERAVMFAGPNDYSSYFSNSAPWLRQPGVTPIEKQFVFLHLRDEIVQFNRQYVNIEGLGMLQDNDTTLVENHIAPFLNSRCLYSNMEPNVQGQFHNSVVIHSSTPRDVNDEPVFSPVWNYMLLEPFSTSSAESGITLLEQYIKVYPNPATSLITIDCGDHPCKHISIYDTAGKMIQVINSPERITTIDVRNLSSGIYYIRCKGATIPVQKLN